MPDTHTSNEAVATQEPPIAMSDVDLERLLDEATSLSRELSEEVGEILNEAPTDEGGVQDEAVATTIETAEPEPPAAAEQIKPLPDLLQDPDAPTAATPAEAEPEPTTNQDAAPETSDPPAPPIRSKGIETRDEEIAEKAASPEPVGDELGKSEDAQEEESRPKGPSVKERLVASCKLAVRLGRAVPIGAANGFLTILILLDRPFRNVSPGLKRALGLVALATLMAGIAAWILPEMMNNNPFAQMERHTKVKG